VFPAGVERFERGAVVLTDGRRLEADLVVLATGHETVREQVGTLLGEATAERMPGGVGPGRGGRAQRCLAPDRAPGALVPGRQPPAARDLARFGGGTLTRIRDHRAVVPALGSILGR
jgi:hypothetical protein